MQSIFGYIPSAIENSQKIADRVDIHIEMGGLLIPRFELPQSDQEIYEAAQKYQKTQKGNWKQLSSDEWYLRYLSFKGLNWRYKETISQEILFELVQKIEAPGLTQALMETSPEQLKELSLTYYSEQKKEILN